MMPFVPILIALRAEVAAALAGKTIRFKPLTLRHYRHRDSTTTERPCVAIKVMAPADVSQYSEQTTSAGDPELVLELSINLVIDMDLVPEADDPADVTGDPTGYGDHAEVLSWILDRLLPDLEAGAMPNTLGGQVWQIRYDGSAPEEGDAAPDFARLEERLTLLYRVRADHPTKLLLET